MQRITITVDDELVTALDRYIDESGHQNRSEAIRDLTRAGLAQLKWTPSMGPVGPVC
jgi:CopG family nickel-responsive transcriptional regulator